MKIAAALKKFRRIIPQAPSTLESKLHSMLALNMVKHRILLGLNNLTVRAFKLPVCRANVFGSSYVHD
jgi:hypothetical protein